MPRSATFGGASFRCFIGAMLLTSAAAGCRRPTIVDDASTPSVPADSRTKRPRDKRRRALHITTIVRRSSKVVVQLLAEGPVHRGPLDWLDDALPRELDRRITNRHAERALGSGIVVGEHEILTSARLIGSRKTLFVRTHAGPDARLLKAKVVGSDATTDLALLRIATTPPVALSVLSEPRPRKLDVGLRVLAIARPFGAARARQGIVAGDSSDTVSSFVEVDLRVDASNVGGLVVDARGDWLGVICSPTGSAGAGFMVPLAVIARALPDLRRYGRVRRSYFGFYVDDVSKTTSGDSQKTGVIVTKILPKSAAAQAGIKVGDIIERFDGKTLTAAAGLPALTAASEGRIVRMALLRGKQKLEIRIKGSPLP